MKKKIILKIIAPVLGLSALIGAFCLVAFSNVKRSNNTMVSADSSIGTISDIGDITYTNVNNTDTTFTINYTSNASVITSSSSPYISFVCSFTIEDDFAVDGTTYTNRIGSDFKNPQIAVYDSIDGNYPTSVVVSFDRAQSAIGNVVYGLFFDVDFKYLDTTVSTSHIAWLVLPPNNFDADNILSISGTFDTLTFDVLSSTGFNDFLNGYTNGYNDGYAEGYNSGNTTGYSNGYEAGYADASSQFSSKYEEGYADGYNAGQSEDSTISSIFSGIIQIALVPVNFFLGMFNFSILGINLREFIQALFTVAITVIVLKSVLGGRGGSND